jgi:hypothetical protein
MVNSMTPQIGATIPAIKIQYANGGSGVPLAAIPEKGRKGGDDEDVFEAMKKKQAAAGGKGGPTY